MKITSVIKSNFDRNLVWIIQCVYVRFTNLVQPKFVEQVFVVYGILVFPIILVICDMCFEKFIDDVFIILFLFLQITMLMRIVLCA